MVGGVNKAAQICIFKTENLSSCIQELSLLWCTAHWKCSWKLCRWLIVLVGNQLRVPWQISKDIKTTDIHIYPFISLLLICSFHSQSFPTASLPPSLSRSFSGVAGVGLPYRTVGERPVKTGFCTCTKKFPQHPLETLVYDSIWTEFKQWVNELPFLFL